MSGLEIVPSLIALVAALVQGCVGVGFAMISVPLLALSDVALVPGPMLIANLALSALMGISGRQAVVAAEFRALVPGLLLGTLLGALAIQQLNPEWFLAGIGGFVLIAVAVAALGASAPLTPRNLAVGGLLAGLMGTLAGIHGPAMAVLYAHAAPEKIRATIAWVFVIASGLSLAALRVAGQLSADQIFRGLWLIPFTLIGFGLARAVQNVLPVRLVRTVMLMLAAASALLLIASALG